MDGVKKGRGRKAPPAKLLPADTTGYGEVDAESKAEGESPDDEILEEARARLKASSEADSDDRERARDELKFAWNVDNAQWDDEAKKVRKNRPMLTENRLPSFIRQAINDIRQSRPAARVLPVDDQADKWTAQVKEGLIRNIEANSRADMAYDNAAQYAGFCGRGYWKITTEYLEDSFDQDIVIVPIKNPFAIFDDPSCQLPDKSDRKFLFEADWVDNDEFEREYGEEPTAFTDAQEALGSDTSRWFEEDKTLIAHYWRVKCDYEPLYQMSDGAVVKDAQAYVAEWRQKNAMMVSAIAAQAAQAVQQMAAQGGDPSQMQIPPAPMLQEPSVVQQRNQERKSVEWFLLTGTKVYRKGKWAGKFIPYAYVGGDEIAIEDKNHTKGMTADVQDLTKANNYVLSAQMESIALSPKVPYIGPKGAFKTDAQKWATANQQSYAYIEFDGTVPPTRSDQVMVQPELASVKAGLVDGMRAVVGLMGASLGDKGPEVAWRAIAARQSEGDTAIFHFMDNLVRAVRYSAMCIIDLIPKVYDTKRVIRIINPDSKPMNVAIGQMFVDPQTGETKEIDFSKGKYDVTVSAGPAFETQRQQTAATLVGLSDRNPALFGAAGDIVVKSLALPQAEEIAERLKRTVPPHVLGEGPTPQEQQLQQQIQQMQQALQEQSTNLAMLQSELAKQQATLAGKQVDYESKVADLNAKIQQSQIDYETALADKERKEAELAMTYAKAFKEVADTAAVDQSGQMLEMVQGLLAEHEQKVGQMLPALEQPDPPDLTPVFEAIQQSNAALQAQIQALAQQVNSDDPIEIIRGLDGRTSAVKKGSKVIQVRRGSLQ